MGKSQAALLSFAHEPVVMCEGEQGVDFTAICLMLYTSGNRKGNEAFSAGGIPLRKRDIGKAQKKPVV